MSHREKYRAFDENTGRERVRVVAFRNVLESGRIRYTTIFESYYKKAGAWKRASGFSPTQLAILQTQTTVASVWIAQQKQKDFLEKQVPELITPEGDRVDFKNLVKSFDEVAQ